MPGKKKARKSGKRKKAGRDARRIDLLATIGAAAAKLAHEIGNPLNGMFTTVQLLESRLSRKKKERDDNLIAVVQDLKKEIARLSTLLDDLRFLSKTQDSDLQPVNLKVLTEELLSTVGPEYEKKGIRIVREFPRSLPRVMADETKIKQALLNLWKNAVEAMPDGGTLTIRLCTPADKVVVEVKDTGGGIEDGVAIFDPFNSTKPHGSGLGLPIVREIVSAHAGTISYTSHPEEGTLFRISLEPARFSETTATGKKASPASST